MTWIISRFKNNGTPATGLSATITIYDLSDNSVVVNGAAMSEIANGAYKYNFSTYDNKKDYLILTDGSATLSDFDRYQEAVSTDARIDTMNTNIIKLIGIQGEWLAVEWTFSSQNNTSIECWQYDNESHWTTHDKSTGLLNHWTMDTTFENGLPTVAKIKREDS